MSLLFYEETMLKGHLHTLSPPGWHWDAATILITDGQFGEQRSLNKEAYCGFSVSVWRL